MTDSVSLKINFRFPPKSGGSYFRLCGVYAGTEMHINVYVYKDGPKASDYQFGVGETDQATLHVDQDDFDQLRRCVLPTPTGQVHQIIFEDGQSPCAVKQYKHCGQTIDF